MKTLYLVACVASKRDGSHPAKELYASDWFRKARAFVEDSGCSWYILSAAHGLLHPEQVIAHYNETLNRMGIKERRRWSEQVLNDLEPFLCRGDHVIFLAGQKYREFLIDPLKAMGVTVEIPMAGLGIGQQLQWLKGHMSR